MIKINLYKCCMECNNADLEVENVELIAMQNTVMKDTIVFCNHECVCKKVEEYFANKEKKE